MLNYLKKFTMDILPSVAATIIGAYIVNHYMAAKPVEAPVAAAVSSADPKKARSGAAKPAETSSDVASIPQPGVKAKGISERAMIEKTVSEGPAVATEKSQAEKAVDKPTETKPTETASIPVVDTHRRPSAPREKAAAKTAPPPQVAAPVSAPPTDAAAIPDERRDANDLARAAIERLRGTNEGPPRAQETARAAEAPRTTEAPRVASAPPVQPLPPPITVSTPAAEEPPYAANLRIDPSRPTPPADIPPPPRPPLDLRADATDPPAPAHKNVAEEMLSAAKSMFHSVLPNSAAK
jgi:hypothetical protein